MNGTHRRVGALRTWTAVLVCGLSVGCGPSGADGAAPSSVPSPAVATGSSAPAPTSTPVPSPVASTLDGLAVSTLSLPPGSAPIDVVLAFGSVWTANHHADTVTRLDPTSLAVEATIKVGSGPGWFAITDDALWVSNQNGVGLSRIDPTTNTSDVHAGTWATCGKPLVTAGRVWQPACDAQRFMAIDPATGLSSDVPATAQWSLLQVGGDVISAGPNGLSRFDPRKVTFTPIGGPDPGRLIGYDGATIWSSDERNVFRIRPSDGSIVATIPIPGAWNLAFVGGHGWVSSGGGLVEVDRKTNAATRTLAIGRLISIAARDGALWVTSFDDNTITRVQVDR